jgi:hypothetical protein
MLVGQQRMLATPRFLSGAIHDALRGFANLVRRDIEFFYVHRLPPSGNEDSNSYASARPWPNGHSLAGEAGYQ